MLRFQKFSLVLRTWPCRLLEPREWYESLLLIHRKIKWDEKLTFLGTNACHEVGIEATILLK